MNDSYLKSTSGDKQVELSGEVVAGRNPECDLVLSDGHPSRRHAQIMVKEDGVWVEDLGSANGTFVNDAQISGSVRLNVGDRVRFDVEEFEFVDASAPAAPPADAGATVVRVPPVQKASGDQTDTPADPAPPPPTAAPPAPPPPVEAEQTVESGAGGAKKPGAWADPNAKNQAGTVLFDPDQLKDLLNETTKDSAPMAEVDAPYLQITSGQKTGTSLKLTASSGGNEWDVGSDADRDIVLEDDGVSGLHAKIVNEGNRWKVIDQMSANGTLVNEKKGTISFLASGDRIRFGPVECVFQLPTGASTKASASASQGGTGSVTRWVIIAIAAAVVAAAALYLL